MKADLVKKPEDWDILHLVDVECTYPGDLSSEGRASQDCNCPYRDYKNSLPASHVEMQFVSESGLSHSSRFPLTLKRS